ncbi:FmdB family zinc ribbon protein [Miltoncostaea marina]|uniref:FmdB family zinc ribbon protein n=1 Tax=Miltoncostaea marina TaxID=2843215 RepID=UPI001C3CBE08|nr:FmdB family zinc ribbon protein [Miltoncostaea marina]
MPFYEYRCEKGHTFEVMQRMSDDPLTECEVCGAPASRVLFAPAIHFKGTGFHNTDYGTKRRSPGGDDGGSSGDSASSNGSGAAGGASDSGSGSGTGAASSASKTVGLDKV